MAPEPPHPSRPGRKTGAHVGFFAPAELAAESGRKTGAHVGFSAPQALDEAIAALALRQYGILELRQLQELGLCASAVQKRSVSGRLHRVHNGVYAVAPLPLLGREAHWMAAVLACGPTAVLSHRSAAALHGLLPHGNVRVEVTVPGRSRGRHPGVLIHRSTTLTGDDITVVRGIAVTTVARTLLDLGSVIARRPLERACDQAEIMQTFDLTAIQDQLQRNRRHHGARMLKSILEEHYIGETETWNCFEESFLAMVNEAGLPRPEVNAFLDLHDGEPAIRVDFLWRPQRLAVETDGRRTHLTHQAFEHDRRRDQRLTVAGWRPARFTRRQVHYRRAEARETLRRLWGV